MAIQTYNSPQPQGLGNIFLENALAGLGQQAGRGLGHGIGLGASKLGKLAGLGGPSSEMMQLLMSQGMTEEQAKAFADLDPRSQQQVLQNLGAMQQGEQQKKAFGQFEEAQAVPGKPLEGTEVIPEIIPSYRDMYSSLRKAGVDPKTAKEYLKEYPKEEEETLKKPKAFIEEIDTGAKAAKESNPRLNRMLELVKKGKLSGSTMSGFVNTLQKGIFGLGVDLSGLLLSPDSEEFQKLTADFSKLIKNYFPGGKITNVMIDQFMKTIPNSLQSDEGKLRVINNLMNINTAAMLNKQAKDEILKETKGKIPANIEELIQTKIGNKLDVLAEKFARGESVIPEYESIVEQVQKRKSNQLVPSLLGGLGGGAAGFATAGPIGIIPGALAGAGGLESLAGLGSPDYERSVRQLQGLVPRAELRR